MSKLILFGVALACIIIGFILGFIYKPLECQLIKADLEKCIDKNLVLTKVVSNMTYCDILAMEEYKKNNPFAFNIQNINISLP
jgi:hypothetical protein